jgi:hypothetical protein
MAAYVANGLQLAPVPALIERIVALSRNVMPAQG